MSQHLRSFVYKDDDFETTYSCKVQSSRKGILHDVQLSIKKSNVLISGECSCARGKEKPCSHMATVLLHINKSVSCTDKLAEWSKRGLIEYETQTIEEMVGSQSVRSITDDQKRIIREQCLAYFKENNVAVPAAWILKSENPQAEDQFDELDLGTAIESVDFALCDDRKLFLECLCALSDEKIAKIVHETVGQRKNNLYCQYKRYRITASNFGYVIAAIERNSYPVSLFGRLLNTSNLERVKAIQWGIQNEKHALETLMNFDAYRHNFNASEIESSGLYLHPCGLLGASPDGVSQEFVLEIKCPYSLRFDVLTAVLKPTIPSKQYIVYFENGKLQINRKHPYYHQIQGQIYLAKKQYGLLFVYTTKSHLLIKIPKDLAWEVNLIKMQNFYYNQFISHIISEL